MIYYRPGIRCASFACLLVCLAMTASTAQAQRWYYDDSPHASTVGESHARGMADVIRSSGEAALSGSAAAINMTTAQSQALDNDLKNTQVYFEKRKINEANTYAKRNRPTQEQVFRLARERAPDRLGASSLDPVTGEINWHFVLEEDAYAVNRQEIQDLFHERAKGDRSVISQIKTACRNAQDEIRKHRTDYTPEDFVGALKFLDSLNYEARFAA